MILEISEKFEIDFDLYRIVDFYVLFPHLLKEISPFPNELRQYKKIIKDIPVSYEDIGNVKRIMFELESVQTTALQNLLAKGFIDLDFFKKKKIRRTKMALPLDILEEIINNEVANSDWFEMLVNRFCDVRFKGKAGLKARSGLMEFRYDMEQS